MHRLTPCSPSRQRPQQGQRGVSLLESLIALVIAALGILGVVGIQMRTLVDTQTTVRRAQAIRLIEDLSERMKVNPNALLVSSQYLSTFADTPSAVDCSAKACNRTELAQSDLATWKKTVRQNLPLGQAAIFTAPGETAGNERQLGIMIGWRENEKDGTKTDAINAVLGGGGAGNAGPTCPTDLTCHLQYIPISARCAPKDNGGTGNIKPYCA